MRQRRVHENCCDPRTRYHLLPFRYVCEDCLRTFKDEIHEPNRKCWTCGGNLIAFQKNRGIMKDGKEMDTKGT